MTVRSGAPGPDGPRLCGILRLSDGLRLDRAPGATEADLRAGVDAAEKAAPQAGRPRVARVARPRPRQADGPARSINAAFLLMVWSMCLHANGPGD